VTLQCERCYWFQATKPFTTSEAVENWFAAPPPHTTDDIFDVGLIPPERSPELRRWQQMLPHSSLRHFVLCTMLNQLDLICEQIVVRVPG
jgi:hypothetical protein